nr:hypothetical protein [Phycisphaerae bacterium]NIR93327.1 hypothetical protein [Gammaproteobacteria bacterium]NIW46580.1 hypothetical protein [Gammaproteobacteria bacterium]NIW98108.1 hypothetical protein [Phycisphaerae bacterium]NIX27828.1 hypothetical protein [Phycisphaerae bacterium]
MSDKSGRKKLLVFAHRGEAKVFIKRGHFQPVGFLFNGLYEREGELLLISGEGVQSTTERLSAVCAAYAKEIETVINMGIAGSLTQNTAEGETEPIELNGIYSVRTVYGDNGSDIAFRTFTSDDPNARIDCISANNRVLEDDDAQRLSWFAQLVDRELWACGSVCALFKLPFCSYKLVSDVAGQGTDCIDISHRAGEFSRRLYQFYGELTAQKKRVAKAENHEWQLPDAFYATTTQRRQLASLLKNLTVKYQTNEAGIQE